MGKISAGVGRAVVYLYQQGALIAASKERGELRRQLVEALVQVFAIDNLTGRASGREIAHRLVEAR